MKRKLLVILMVLIATALCVSAVASAESASIELEESYFKGEYEGMFAGASDAQDKIDEYGKDAIILFADANVDDSANYEYGVLVYPANEEYNGANTKVFKAKAVDGEDKFGIAISNSGAFAKGDWKAKAYAKAKSAEMTFANLILSQNEIVFNTHEEAIFNGNSYVVSGGTASVEAFAEEGDCVIITQTEATTRTKIYLNGLTASAGDKVTLTLVDKIDTVDNSVMPVYVVENGQDVGYDLAENRTAAQQDVYGNMWYRTFPADVKADAQGKYVEFALKKGVGTKWIVKDIDIVDAGDVGVYAWRSKVYTENDYLVVARKHSDVALRFALDEFASLQSSSYVSVSFKYKVRNTTADIGLFALTNGASIANSANLTESAEWQTITLGMKVDRSVGDSVNANGTASANVFFWYFAGGDNSELLIKDVVCNTVYAQSSTLGLSAWERHNAEGWVEFKTVDVEGTQQECMVINQVDTSDAGVRLFSTQLKGKAAGSTVSVTMKYKFDYAPNATYGFSVITNAATAWTTATPFATQNADGVWYTVTFDAYVSTGYAGDQGNKTTSGYANNIQFGIYFGNGAGTTMTIAEITIA